MTDAPVEEARELVELAEARYRSPDRRETHYAVWEADEAASEALEALGEDETPAALELRARARVVQSGVAARLGEDETARERYRQAARLGVAAGTERGLEAAADAWYELAVADDGVERDTHVEAYRRCVDAGRRAGTDVGRSRACRAATGLASELRARGRPGEAAEALETALELGADVDGVFAESLAETALVLGRVEKEVGEDRAAENAWERAVEFGWEPEAADGPVHAAVLASVELGAVRARRGDTDAAREALCRVVELEPSDVTGEPFVDDVAYEVTTKRETLALAGLYLLWLAEATGDGEAAERARERARQHLEALEDGEPAGAYESLQRRVGDDLGLSIDELLTRGNGGAGP